MKTRMFILAALAAPLLAWGAPISDIGDLIANPDDVMLRKPAKKAAAPKPAIDPALEAAAKADVDRRFAEAKARAEANARLAAEQEAAARKAKADAAKGRTAQAAEGTRRAAERAGLSADRGGERSSAGSWSLRELKGMFGDNDFDQRTANASENTVRLQQETNRYLRKMSAQTLAYGG